MYPFSSAHQIGSRLASQPNGKAHRRIQPRSKEPNPTSAVGRKGSSFILAHLQSLVFTGAP